MLKRIIVVLLIFHGLIHLFGFVKAFDVVPFDGLSGETIFVVSANVSKWLGIGWLAACLVLLLSVVGLLLNKAWWGNIMLAGIILSQILMIIYWHDAKAGTIINVVLLVIYVVTAQGYYLVDPEIASNGNDHRNTNR
jgi:hypothetical protein